MSQYSKCYNTQNVSILMIFEYHTCLNTQKCYNTQNVSILKML